MKIALVNTTLRPGRGSDLVVQKLAESLSDHNDVSVFAPFGGTLTVPGCNLIVAPTIGGVFERWRNAVALVWALYRQADRFDVINCHHALLSLILPKRRLITTYHGYRGRLNFMFGRSVAEWISRAVRDVAIRRALRRSRAVTLVSQSLEAEAHAAGRGDASVVYNGVEFLPNSTEAPHAGIGDYFLYVGRIDPDKSVDQLIAFYCATAVQIPLWIVGDGADRQRLESNCRDPRVRFLGVKTREELPALFSRARAFVTASTYETFCLPVIEAAQFGRPSIGPASGALTEVIRHEQTGFLFGASNFAQQLERLACMDAADFEQIADACRKWAAHFTWSKTASEYEFVYRTVCTS